VTLVAAAVATLEGWRAPSAGQERLRRDYLDHLASHPDGAWRHGPPAHLTVSCFVLDPAARHALLTLHRKGGFWVQFGGHCEDGDTDLAAAALREAREESGVAELTLLPAPVDLDRHRLPPQFGRCREHLDVAFAATAPAGAVPQVSDESDDVAWWRLDGLPAGVVPDLPPRLARVAGLVRAQSAAASLISLPPSTSAASPPTSSPTSSPMSRSAAAATPSR
jgi:8-oxo-dGTP pyrophosphatase MutT (NUDIX family)